MSRFYYCAAWALFAMRVFMQVADVLGVRERNMAFQTDSGVAACFFLLLAIYERRSARPTSPGGTET